MLDLWYTFPASMGDDQAWISFNQGYAEVAEADTRNNHFRVRVRFKKPNELGLPTNEEFPALSALDEKLDDAVTTLGGVYVGRIAVSGSRFFYFYTDKPEQEFQPIIDKVEKASGYDLTYLYKEDPEKKYYWNELYPTDDDWQVIEDLKVLRTLVEEGDKKDKKRPVSHWAYFKSKEAADKFAIWAKEQNYTSIDVDNEKKGEYSVNFTHVGTMHLTDITSHTITSNRKAKELGGEYDGWETSVEKN